MSAKMQYHATADDHSLLWAYQQLKTTGRGKHVRRFSYYHATVLTRLPKVRCRLDSLRHGFHAHPFEFNVIKLNPRSRISFLRYESFDKSFPSLLAALSCDLARRSARQIDFTARRNPPILHRKELLLPENDPRVAEATRLTDRLERQGAFSNPATIGTRDGWQRQLLALGLEDLRESAAMNRPAEPIARHRTALRRSTLSSPFRHLLDFGFLDGRRTVFDYGCGRGDDLRLLTGMGVDAKGWDPVYRPNAPPTTIRPRKPWVCPKCRRKSGRAPANAQSRMGAGTRSADRECDAGL